MYLLVNPDGKRYWRLDYRFGGKRKTLALGVYPEVSLKPAREKREQARSSIAAGRDPAHGRRIERLTRGAALGDTFGELAKELIANMQREGRAQVTIDTTQWMLEFAYPYIGERPIAEITAAEVLVALKSVEARGRYETAQRLGRTVHRSTNTKGVHFARHSSVMSVGTFEAFFGQEIQIAPSGPIAFERAGSDF